MQDAETTSGLADSGHPGPMRRLTLILALAVSTLWLGGNLALVLGAMQVFPMAKDGAIDAGVREVGEVFGIMFAAWAVVMLVLLGLLIVLRVWHWILVLRRQRISVGIGLAAAALLALVVTTLAASQAVFAANEAYLDEDRARTDEERTVARERFTEAHVASTTWNSRSLVALIIVVVGLGVALQRDGREHNASA